MNSNETAYSRFEPHPEEIAFSSFSKQPQAIVTQTEQNWIPQTKTGRTPRSRAPGSLLYEWRWEISAWLLGTCAIGSIVALLIVFNNRPLREWTPRFRPAPAVAALSQVAQSALLFSVSSCIGQLKWDWLRQTRSASDFDKFEDAARGPQGSLLLLPRTRLHLVSIGALATILLLIFSPATQLSNTIEVRIVNNTGTFSNVTISRSVQYMFDQWNTSLINQESRDAFNKKLPGLSDVHPHMHKAVLSGIFEEHKSLSEITGNCQAELCRWEDYTTLAVCATIEEVSSQGEMYNTSSKFPGFRLRGMSWSPPEQLGTNSDTFWMTAPFGDSSNVTKETLRPIADVFVAHYPQCNDQGKSRGDSKQFKEQLNFASNWKAYKGTFNLCLQTLSSTYNNTMNTTIIETQKDLKWKSKTPGGLNGTVCLSQPHKGENFCVGSHDLQQWSTSLARTLEGAATLYADADNYYKGQWVPNIVGDILGPTPAACDPTLGPHFDRDGFTRRVNNIAISMSNAMRTGNTTSPDSIVRGSAWSSEQFIAVEFKWLTPPLVIYFAITLFLFATIFKSRKGDVPLWKSSPLVLLHSMERNNGMQTLDQVEKVSRDTRVQLQFTGENWHLQDVTGRQLGYR